MMTDFEMEAVVQELFSWLQRRYQELEAEEDFIRDVRLGSGATEAEIGACEKFLGRRFSPSYRQFLALHDGLRGFHDREGWLFGTRDYMTNPDGRHRIASTFYTFLHSRLNEHEGEWFEEWPQGSCEPPVVYRPENFYRMLRGQWPDARYDALIEYMKSHRESEDGPLMFNHTLIGLTGLGVLFLDGESIVPGGEMEVLIYQIGDDTAFRERDFGQYLRRIADGLGLFEIE